MRGLLVDPGAARGLIGTETLRLLLEEVIYPAKLGHLVSWKESFNSFTGISPKAEQSLGMVTIPIGLLGLSSSWFTADVIGGASSLCPGLIPLKSLIYLGCCILFSYYGNGDGVLGIWSKPRKSWTAQRLHLTDSGHYLLRIDGFDKEADKAASHVIQSTTGPVGSAAQTSKPRRTGFSQPAVDASFFVGVTACRSEHTEVFQ